MKALVLNGYGGNDRLAIVERPAPLAGPDDVLIRTSHAGLNPLDYKVRQGALRAIRPLVFPHVMGNELAGVVESVGANVSRFRAGDRVYARVDRDKMGAFAERVAQNHAVVAHAPKSVAPETAAGIPLVALTAWQALADVAKLQSGQSILIQGGAGSVGRFAIQFARRLGAQVTTTGSGTSRDLVTGLGAHTFIDYRTERFEDGGARFDVVLDLVGGETLDRSFSVVRHGGQVVSIAGMPEPNTATELGKGVVFRWLFGWISRKQRALAKQSGSTYRYLFMHPDGAFLEQLAGWIDRGEIRADIDRVFPWTDFARAFEAQESGSAKGKLVLDLRSP